MYYHATASGELICTVQPINLLDFRLDEHHSCIIHSNAASQAEAVQGRQRLLLRLTERRLEHWLSLEVF